MVLSRCLCVPPIYDQPLFLTQLTERKLCECVSVGSVYVWAMSWSARCYTDPYRLVLLWAIIRPIHWLELFSVYNLDDSDTYKHVRRPCRYTSAIDRSWTRKTRLRCLSTVQAVGLGRETLTYSTH